MNHPNFFIAKLYSHPRINSKFFTASMWSQTERDFKCQNEIEKIDGSQRCASHSILIVFISATERRQNITELVEERDINNSTVLHLAAGTNDLKTGEVCLQNGADINALKSNNETSLYVATVKGNLQMVKLLVRKGADVNVKNADTKTVLHR